MTDHPTPSPAHRYTHIKGPFGLGPPIHKASPHLKPMAPDKPGKVQQCTVTQEPHTKYKARGLIDVTPRP